MRQFHDTMLAHDSAASSFSHDALPVCLGRENPHRLVSLWDMYQFAAHRLLKLFDELRNLEIELVKPLGRYPTHEEDAEISRRFLEHLRLMKFATEDLQLSSSQKQLSRIIDTIINKKVSGNTISPLLTELRVRIQEDLENHVYLFIPERAAGRYFSRTERGYESKVPGELMDPKIVEIFPSASDDIEATYKCFIFDCYPASMFHLMRVVEVGVLRLAKMAGLKDPAPSWGAVLQYVEKIVLRTKYEDVDPSVQPHRKMLESILPQMQAIQRAWRNKFTHVEDKIIPAEAVMSESIAIEILTAVEAFMRELACDLPPTV